jgi:hypothetical protein
MTVRGKKIVRRTTAKVSSSKRGHTYEYIGWSSTKVLGREGSASCTVTLKDVTTDEMITRKGKAYAYGGETTIFLNTLEGCKDIQVQLHTRGEKGIIRILSSRCILVPID